jgi:NAD(P)H-nitrite reductase large subunit
MSDDEVLVCRCEEVTRKELREAIKNGGIDMDKLKRMTRAGMGLCQGRTCRKTVMQILAEELGVSVEELEVATFRAPLRPLEMKVLISPKEPPA